MACSNVAYRSAWGRRGRNRFFRRVRQRRQRRQECRNPGRALVSPGFGDRRDRSQGGMDAGEADALPHRLPTAWAPRPLILATTAAV